MGHTPTPWRTRGTNYGYSDKHVLGPPHPDGSDWSPICVTDTVANAEFIVRAVNCHADMLAALEETMRVLRSLRDHCQPEWDAITTADLLNAWDANKAAIAKAKEGL